MMMELAGDRPPRYRQIETGRLFYGDTACIETGRSLLPEEIETGKSLLMGKRNCSGGGGHETILTTTSYGCLFRSFRTYMSIAARVGPFSRSVRTLIGKHAARQSKAY